VKKVWDNSGRKGPYWAVLIETEERGPVKFNLFDGAFAGKPSKDHDGPTCDVHDLIDQRVVFGAELGAEKKGEDGQPTGERWPSTLTLVMPEADRVAAPEPLVNDEARSEEVEALMGIAAHLEAASRHIGAAMELARK